MRRKEKQMSKDRMYEYLRIYDVVRIAFNDKDYPYVVPMNFGYECIDA